MKYKVVQGVHVQDGRTYGKGKVVQSEANLIELFPNKFELIPDSAVPAEADSKKEKSEKAAAAGAKDKEYAKRR